MKHPIQAIDKDKHGTYRFNKNSIVEFLLEAGPFDMNQLARMEFSSNDREQFAQLIGYSLSGFGELSYVSNDTYDAAEEMLSGLGEKDARITALENALANVRQGMITVIPYLFNIHGDDLLAE